ncbi:hypothetical protein OPV22_000570 [Ensete ventricosum]|uniref:Uncharacterized protein n=1 Tax=Ensete ventricosum TaxID=4639 RepID=A0AAV8QGI7_ENSVE|nr:hypothetical protein OPV22_000570 [Ensete ventricosum]
MFLRGSQPNPFSSSSCLFLSSYLNPDRVVRLWLPTPIATTSDLRPSYDNDESLETMTAPPPTADFRVRGETQKQLIMPPQAEMSID